MKEWNLRIFNYGAEGRSRTDMSYEARWILSPVRLPISPLRQQRKILKNYSLDHY